MRIVEGGRVGAVRSPVFIVGSPRSGTSALVSVLSDVGYHGFLEGNFLPLLRHIDGLVDDYYVNFPDADELVMLSNIDKRDLKHKLFEALRTTVNDLNPKEPWFDKTANLDMTAAIPIVRELWPDSVFVFAKRRGIENVVSRVKKFPGASFEYHCVDWAATMGVWRTIRQQLPPGCFIEVEQRDMIEQPERTARRLFAFLQLDENAVPADPSIVGGATTTLAAACYIMTTQRPQQSVEGSASKIFSLAESGWTIEQMETFLKHCETEMKEFGYTLDEQYSATL